MVGNEKHQKGYNNLMNLLNRKEKTMMQKNQEKGM